MAKSPAPPRKLESTDIVELYEMLSYMRPHASKAEEEFITRFLVPLGGMKQDQYGNLYKRIGNDPVAWSCHTDTVHRAGGRQSIIRDDKYILKLTKNSGSNCLGADDTAGVWLMAQMIKAKVPGLYMFHRGEEIGCKGSRWVAKNVPGVLKGIKFVIALDRRDNDSVITHQVGQRCCSENFAKSMGEQLGDLKYKADPTGSFTDSASYTDIVGECTNLSVGYKGQHGGGETLDLNHLALLYGALVQVDSAKLVDSRKPGEKESRYQNSEFGYGGYHGGGHHYNNFGNWEGRDEWRRTYYAEQFRGGYFRDGIWRACTRTEWDRWRTTIIEGKEVMSKIVTAGSKQGAVDGPGVPTTDDPELLKMIEALRSNLTLVAQMLVSWGFDDKMLRENLLEFVFHKGDDEKDEIEEDKTLKPEEDKPSTAIIAANNS